ncbi:MAG TPA: DUF2238 domain-containing protein [Ruminiclostridium sp.]
MSIKKRKYSLVYASKYAVSFKKNRPLHLMIAIYIIFLVILSVEPFNGFEWWYGNLAAVIVVTVLAVSYRRGRLTNSSYACILLLLILHTVGAHYTYLFCPIGDWMKGICGFKRNNYDRLVSFAFGLIISIPVIEVLYHRLRLRYIQACVLSAIIILSICSFYELVEMYSSMILSSQQAVVFLGRQGDMWDSQNDMGMGLLGSLITMGGCIFFKLKKNHKIHMVKYNSN